MKKLLSIVALTLFTSTQALASVPFGTSQSFYSDEPSYNFEIKIANNDNSIANLLNGYVDIMTAATSTDLNDKEVRITNLFLDAIEGENMQINAQNSGYWFQVEQSESEFQTMLSEIQSITSLKEEVAGPSTAYEFRFGDMAFANIQGKLVLSDSSDTIFSHDEEVSTDSITLATDDIFTIEGTLDGNDLDYTLSEENGVITSQSSTELPSSIDTASFNSTNHLYDDLRSENPAIYVEFTQALNIIKGLFPEDENIEAELEAEFGEELPSYESIFNKQTAFLVDLNDSIIPVLTLAMADVTSTEANEIMTLISEELPDEISNSEFNIQFSDINSELKKVTITPTPENVEADVLNIEEIVIMYGIYEGNFVVTNNADLLTQSTRVSDSTSFTNSFATDRADVASVSYIDFGAIADQISVYKNNLSRIDETIAEQDTTQWEAILEEMGVWSGYSYLDGQTLEEIAKLQIPTDSLLEQIETATQNLANQLSYTYSPYTDVEETDWYYDQVAQAYEMFIIDTYDYETETFSYDFRPGKDITRGEFVQMIIAAYELEYEAINEYGSDIFSDVDSESYFDYAIGVAYQKGIIQGDDGANTFRPNDTLNRAEAIQILYNASPLLNGKQSTQNNFNDVPEGVWYENVVSVAVQEAIVEGINPQEFAPGKNLNKAEAVTLLIRLVNNEVRL